MNKYIIIGAVIIVAYLYLSKKKAPVVLAVTTPSTPVETASPVESVSPKAVEPVVVADVNSSASAALNQLSTPV